MDLSANACDNRYVNNDIGWDLGVVSTPLKGINPIAPFFKIYPPCLLPLPLDSNFFPALPKLLNFQVKDNIAYWFKTVLEVS
jgi:hypothetical protein